MLDEPEPVNFLAALQENRDAAAAQRRKADRERQWLQDNEARRFFRLHGPLGPEYLEAIEQFTKAGFSLPDTWMWLAVHPNTHETVAFGGESLPGRSDGPYMTDQQWDAKWSELTRRVYALWNRNHRRCRSFQVAFQLNSEDIGQSRLVIDEDRRGVYGVIEGSYFTRGTPTVSEFVEWLVHLANRQLPPPGP